MRGPKIERGTGKTVKAADEADWINLLIASERVSEWLDTLRQGQVKQKKQAAHRLLHEIQSKEAYMEEARSAGAINVLTNVIRTSDDEELISQAAAIIAACSGPAAGGKRVQEVHYGQHTIRIQEGALGDGLGARIWVAAHCLCRRLEAMPEMVRDLSVLEIGSGTGLCGLLAAKLGAAEVKLTDYEHSVLLNLQDCVAANRSQGTPTLTTSQAHKDLDLQQSYMGEPHFEKDTGTSGPELEGPDADKGNARRQSSAWDMENVEVHRLDWIEALPAEERPPVMQEDMIAGRGADAGGPRSLQRGDKFPVIIGSDLIYELYHSDMVAAVLRQRLTPEGKAYIALAVRRQAHLDRLVEKAKSLGLKVEIEQQEVDAEAVGVVGRENEYEGGFVILTISHT